MTDHPLLDHLVGGCQQRFWDGEAERLDGLEVDHQLEFGWHLHREVGGLLALEDAVDVAGGLPELVDLIRLRAGRQRRRWRVRSRPRAICAGPPA